MAIKVSIIIPVYNTSNTLKKCLDSAIHQTFPDCEIICINDGSTDDSLAVLMQYAQKYEQVKVIDLKKNSGGNGVRFFGIKEAKGEYLTFLDADDWLSLNAVELLFNNIEKEQSDIVFGGMTRVLDSRGLIKAKGKNSYKPQNLTQSITQPVLFNDYFISYFGINLLTVGMAAKLYRKGPIEKANLQPSTLRISADLMFNLELHPFLNKISFIEDNIYFYRFGGMTSRSNPKFMEEVKSNFLIKEDYIRKYHYQKASPFVRYELINYFYSHFNNLLLFDKKKPEEVRALLIQELNKEFYTQNDIFNDIKLNAKSLSLKTKDIDKIMEILLNTYKKKVLKFRLKKVLSKLLASI